MPKPRIYLCQLNKSRLKSLPTGMYALTRRGGELMDRYDLLCIEGLARALRVFLQKEQPPTYTLSNPAQMQEVFVEASVRSSLEPWAVNLSQASQLRPYFASAILRLARPLNNLEYESFIDLQDKLHQNLCRMRKFVAIGTHDLDTIQGPFRYVYFQ